MGKDEIDFWKIYFCIFAEKSEVESEGEEDSAGDAESVDGADCGDSEDEEF